MSIKLVAEVQSVGIPEKKPTRFDIVIKFHQGGFSNYFDNIILANEYCNEINNFLKNLDEKYNKRKLEADLEE